MNRNFHVQVGGQGTSRTMKLAAFAVMLVAVASSAFYLSYSKLNRATTQAVSSMHPVASPISVPMFFEANQGQTDANVKFLARGHGYGLFLTANEAVLDLHNPKSAGRDVIRMKLAGANPASSIDGKEPLRGKSNYFIGNDPKKWRTNVPQFGRVEYQGVYPGVDLAYYGNQGQLEYDFQVAPGADPKQIAMTFEGAAPKIEAGELVLATANGDVRFHAPYVYQREGSEKKAVDGRFVELASNRIGFELGAYDHSRELVIDPTLSYSTYLGGTGVESLTQVAVGTNLNVYVAGTTESAYFFPATVPAAIQATLKGSSDIFIAQLDLSKTGASQLVFATYLGGDATESAAGIAVDINGNIYVGGTTTSANFPTNGTMTPFQATATGTHGFVTKIGTVGSNMVLQYSTYLAGDLVDHVTGVAADVLGNVYLTGDTTSSNFPTTTNAYQTRSLAPATQLQFFATKINTNAGGATSLTYSTYFGGAGSVGGPATAQGGGVATDGAGNIYITGTTNFVFDSNATGANPRTNFPILNAAQPCLNDPIATTSCNPNSTATDAFAARINPGVSGTGGLVFSTFLGGSNNDLGTAIAVDAAKNVYVTGSTESTNWNAAGTAFQANPGAGTGPGVTDAFIVKIGALSGSIYPVSYFSYLGGSGSDVGKAIAADSQGAVHVAGSTNSPNLPVVLQNYGLGLDAFVAVAQTTSGGASGGFLSYLGGSGDDEATSIALDVNNNTYVAGTTTSGNFPLTSNPFQAALEGSQDAFVSQVTPSGSLTLARDASSPSPNPVGAGNAVTFTWDITNAGPDPANNIVVLLNYPTSGTGSQTGTISSGTGQCSGPANGSITCTVNTLAVNGIAKVSMSVTPTVPLVNSTVTVKATASANGGSFNQVVSQSAVVTDFSITSPPPSPATVTVAAGQTASFNVTVTPVPQFSGAISMSQSGLPTNATATYTTSSITLSGSSPASTTLNIATVARPVTTGSLMHSAPLYATWLPVGGISLLGLGVGLRRRKWLAGALLGFVAALILFQSACGNSSSSPTPSTGTPAGTYVVTITAASGSDTHSTPVTLIVQ